MSSLSERHDIKTWNTYYKSLTDAYLFPNEYVVRSFLGKYPNLDLDRNYRGKRVCDISCGDGRNITALHKFGFDVYGSEISDEICQITMKKLRSTGVTADIRAGTNRSLPFEAGTFDYILSWNACYYMESVDHAISEHVNEYARIMKPGGYCVVSVPSPGCFSLIGAEELGDNLIRINTDTKWNMLNGTIYYRFDSFEHIDKIFGTHFRSFQKCTIKDDCYGLPLEYFVFVCQRK
jgi:2-polyprenyl-3-methyl-5-hydroxy-6-metoxy-1,4-benzoquinol methylase